MSGKKLSYSTPATAQVDTPPKLRYKIIPPTPPILRSMERNDYKIQRDFITLEEKPDEIPNYPEKTYVLSDYDKTLRRQ